MTHAFDQDQRAMTLEHARTGTMPLRVASPNSGFETPPGYYMLFVVSDGVPSIAKWVKIVL